ncbi:MAG: hypothetical protein J6S60_00160 [Oscillospiraceae bacterium]|nr:hypothetical protein [Oscillospiraceae bacterium]
MTNKTRAIVEANKHLRAENREMWGRNEALENGAAEMKIMYESLIMQIIQKHGHATNEGGTPYQYVVLDDTIRLGTGYELRALRREDGRLELRVMEADDGAEHQD